MTARRAFEGESLQRVVALWEAWELYAGAVAPAPAFSGDELKRLRKELPGWLSEVQRQRLVELFALANNHPLRRRLREALERDGVPMGDGEWTALWKLRRPRNRTVHGGSTDGVSERELELACSLLCRALVYRLGRTLEPAI